MVDNPECVKRNLAAVSNYHTTGFMYTPVLCAWKKAKKNAGRQAIPVRELLGIHDEKKTKSLA